MRILLVHSKSETISSSNFVFEQGDITILCINGWLRFLVNLSKVITSSWSDWKCIEEVVQTEYLPKEDTVLLDSDGIGSRRCDKSNIRLLNTMFLDEAIHSYLNNVLSYASFKDERLDMACFAKLLAKPGITPSRNSVRPPKPIVEPVIKVDNGPTRPEVVPVTPHIKSRKEGLQRFILQFFERFFPGKPVKVDVYFNSEAFSLCEQYKIAYPKEFLVTAESNSIAEKQEWIESFIQKRVKVINNNLLYWEDIKV